MEIEISAQFKQVLDFVNRTAKPVFLTGKAGTGKTTLLKYIRENTHKQLAICAPTGVAAINAGGTTIHSFFQFPFTPFLPKFKENGDIDASGNNLPALKYNSQRLAIFRSLELLVIDEVSMVRADILDQIDITLRHTRRNWQQPFGGVQLLLIGDMYQLPPVVQSQEWDLLRQVYKSVYFFESLALKKNPPVFIELDKIYRQNESQFINLLNKVRNDEMDEAALTLLNSHFKPEITAEDYAKNITLTTHNRKADEINSRNLAALPGKAFSFSSEVTGLFPDKNFPAENDLVLKVGTRVMFLKNNNEKNYYNGKIGIVTFLDSRVIKVKCEEDRNDIEVARETWTNVSYQVDSSTKHIEEDILGTFIQFPLRLAWAITIHKSQGLTFDKLIIDAAEAFSAGQVYVALSRCRSLSGLTLSSRIIKRSLANDAEIIDFTRSKPASETVKTIFTEAQRKYAADILFSLFDFSDQSDSRKELASLAIMHDKRLDFPGRNWLNTLFQKIDNLKEVSDRFKFQLDQLAGRSENYESDPKLQERLKQAAVYFIVQINHVLSYFNNCEVRTESKEAATDLNAPLQLMAETLFAKKELMVVCENGFTLPEYVKTRLKIVYPATKVNVLSSAGNSKIPSEVRHPDLYRQLLQLRDEICSDGDRPIFMVANAKTLTELSNRMPVTIDQLIEVSGFGEAKANQFGSRFLNLIKQYRSENQITIDFEEKPKKTRKKKKSGLPFDPSRDDAPKEKVSSGEFSRRLFMAGFTPQQIAEQRNCTLGTVNAHLLPFVRNGEIKLEGVVQPEKIEEIQAVVRKLAPSATLSAIKSKLPGNIDYSDIRFVVAAEEVVGDGKK